ncbi:MAG: amino acid permease [Saprospiraceae bacterium]|nr:amino acid permease [Saprospiraceae bacterium]
MAIALVIGNMIGSGIFFLPSSLGAYGGISIFGWLFTSTGALILALIFSRLSRLLPNISGGPFVYSQEGFGDFPGFLVAWGYILSIWASNAAITVAFVSYLSVFLPVLATNNILAAATGLMAIWFLTWLNSQTIRTAGSLQLVTTILKLVPLILISVVGVFYLNPEHFSPMNISTSSNFQAISATAAMTLFAFLGFESATVPAEDVENPEKTIPTATVWGTLITIVVYILGTIAVMGLISPANLQSSNAPFAEAAQVIWGNAGRYLVAGGVVISTFGALNGWTILQGQVPMAPARQHLFPKIFARKNKNGSPSVSLVIGSIIVSTLMLMNFSKGMVKAFEFLILVTTTTVLIPYIFAAAAYGVFVLQRRFGNEGNVRMQLILPMLGFAYSVWMVSGSGYEPVYWGFIMLLLGIPIYVYMKRENKS